MIDVVIVEDDPMVAAINGEYLARLNAFSLRGSFTTGKDCLEFLKEHKINLLLLDVFMSGMDGLQLLQRVRHEHPRVDVIMITADRSSEDIKAALRLGVIDYLMKPFTFERFEAALVSYRERRRLLDSHTELDQGLLDRRVFIRAKPSLPKGVDMSTLEIIQTYLESQPESCSIKGMEQAVGLSRVSIKKYLVYLEYTGKVVSHLEYSAVGRPVRKYRLL
ncbi:response regulator [Oleispirillum naphthae]|uniref:response regulator n=1 Tax=Oleispirillum naphthae TaxID=2838853 RepID=UPI0030822993